MYYESKITSINNFKSVDFPFLQDIRFNIFSFTPTITFKEAAISLQHLGKSISEGNLCLGPLEII